MYLSVMPFFSDLGEDNEKVECALPLLWLHIIKMQVPDIIQGQFMNFEEWLTALMIMTYPQGLEVMNFR